MSGKKSLAFIIACVLVVLLLSGGHASAGLILNFSVGGSFGNAFDVAPSDVDPVKVSVYAEETDPNTELSDMGTIGMGTRASFNAGLGTITEIKADSIWSGPGADTAAGNDWLTFKGTTSAGGSNARADENGRILLGHFLYKVNGPGETVFDFGDYKANDPDFGAPDPSDPDVFIDYDPIFFGNDFSGTYRLTLNAVPEPSSFALGLTAAIAGVFLVRRRRAPRQTQTFSA